MILIKSEDYNGVLRTIVYDEFYKPNKERIEFENEYMEYTTTYDGNFVQSTIDSNNISTFFDINQNTGNVKKITNNIENNTINYLYDYNKYNDVIFYGLNKNNSADNLQEIEYSYLIFQTSLIKRLMRLK